MNVIVYVKTPAGDVQAVTVPGASEARHEKANRHGAKPAVLSVYAKTEGDWSGHEVLAEFNTADVVAWVRTEEKA